MIYICIDDKAPPAEWLAKAEKATQELEAATTTEERHAIIDKYSSLWGELKGWLLDLSHGKCWFSETHDVFSHPHVEHFRPKKKAKNLNGDKREGYWWLAFDWKNYRICGSVGNTKKGIYFPLRDGCHPATSERRTIEDEIYYILDPTDPDDPPLLAFNENGDAIPQPGLDEWQTERVHITVERLKLDHQPLANARRSAWKTCRNKMHECQNRMRDQQQHGSTTYKTLLKRSLNDLREMVKPQAQLSAVSIECLLKSDYGWARRIAIGR